MPTRPRRERAAAVTAAVVITADGVALRPIWPDTAAFVALADLIADFGDAVAELPPDPRAEAIRDRYTALYSAWQQLAGPQPDPLPAAVDLEVPADSAEMTAVAEAAAAARMRLREHSTRPGQHWLSLDSDIPDGPFGVVRVSARTGRVLGGFVKLGPCASRHDYQDAAALVAGLRRLAAACYPVVCDA